ncbi:WD40-repeat-containing domain protein [Pelagophyceae sp. CCMP2097]|nr:WD40-repeat-containing domain protein [Pelagophyceae sp. CCMP2097]
MDGGPPPRKSELDQLHALGDSKYGRPRGVALDRSQPYGAPVEVSAAKLAAAERRARGDANAGRPAAPARGDSDAGRPAAPALGDGWHRGDDGLLHKDYDPHASARAVAYEASLQEHQKNRQLEGAASYASNNSSTAAARGADARAKAAAAREDKIDRARKFNVRHEAALERRHSHQPPPPDAPDGDSARGAKLVRGGSSQRLQRSESTASVGTAPRKHAAAQSHLENAAYMKDMREAYDLDAPAAAVTRVDAGAADSLTRSRIACRPQGKSSGSWRSGPRDARGVLVACSDRPLLCLSVSDSGQDVVAGGADHSLHGFRASDVSRGGDLDRPTRQMHSQGGHSDWVSCCAHIGDELVLSAGVDGRICLWRGTRCVHEARGAGGASVSVLAVDDAAPLALTAGYDGVATLWSVSSDRCADAATFVHPKRPSPVLCAAWVGRDVVLGDRDGRAALYDASMARAVGTWAPPNAGHCVAVAALHGDEALFATGCADGRLRIWDARSRSRAPAREFAAHVSGTRVGAVGCVVPLDAASVSGASGHVIATAGADGAICVCDDRSERAPLFRFLEHRDYPYSLAVMGSFLVSGAGDGAVLCHDVSGAGECVWGLGAGTAAVRCLDARPDRLVAAGDDGNVVVYDF